PMRIKVNLRFRTENRDGVRRFGIRLQVFGDSNSFRKRIGAIDHSKDIGWTLRQKRQLSGQRHPRADHKDGNGKKPDWPRKPGTKIGSARRGQAHQKENPWKKKNKIMLTKQKSRGEGES